MAKEKSLAELRAEKAEAIKRAKEITEKAKAETRKLSDEEMTEHNGLNVRIAEINTEIVAHEEENRSAGQKYTGAAKKEKFSLQRAIAAMVFGEEQRDAEAAAIAMATEAHTQVIPTSKRDKRALIVPFETRATYTAATEAATGVVIDDAQQELLLPLRPALVLAQAGARMLTGLTGNIYWPNHSDVNVFWEGENTAAKDGAGEFEKGTVYAPKRLTAYVNISKQLLVQENMSVEGLIRQLFAEKIAQKIEETAFSKAAHVDNVPDGIFQSFVAANALGAISWANVVKMETNADLKNAAFGNLAYIMHPALLGAAKTKVKDASGAGGFIIGNDGAGMLNGYRALRTNNLPKELGTATDEYGIVFGNWGDFFLGQWGALEMMVDPYSRALEGEVRLIVNSYWNMGVIRDESFTIASMK